MLIWEFNSWKAILGYRATLYAHNDPILSLIRQLRFILVVENILAIVYGNFCWFNKIACKTYFVGKWPKRSLMALDTVVAVASGLQDLKLTWGKIVTGIWQQQIVPLFYQCQIDFAQPLFSSAFNRYDPCYKYIWDWHRQKKAKNKVLLYDKGWFRLGIYL